MDPWDKRAWLEGAPFRLGTYLQTTDPAVVEILALAGFDFVVVDLEHGPLDLKSMRLHALAARAAGLVCLVRVRDNRPSLINQPLDAGAHGVQVPQVEEVQAAEAALRAAKYHPRGQRGSNPYVRATGYGRQDYGSYLPRANRESLVVLQIEGTGGLANLEEIVALPDLDVAWLGPYDLAQALGHPGRVDHPEVRAGLEKTITLAGKREVLVGSFADRPEAARGLVRAGVRLVAVSYETGILLDGASRLVEEVRS